MRLPSGPPYSWFGPYSFIERLPIEGQANVSDREANLIHQQQNALGMGEEWGWCMWDRDRLLRCGMVRGRHAPYFPLSGSRKSLAWLRVTSEAHKRCVARLRSTLDHRLRMRFDADVARVGCERLQNDEVKRWKKMQHEEFLQRNKMMQWVRWKDATLYEEWSSILQSEDYDKEDQKKAKFCYNKTMLLKKLAKAPSKQVGVTSEEWDLELLACYRACR